MLICFLRKLIGFCGLQINFFILYHWHHLLNMHFEKSCGFQDFLGLDFPLWKSFCGFLRFLYVDLIVFAEALLCCLFTDLFLLQNHASDCSFKLVFRTSNISMYLVAFVVFQASCVCLSSKANACPFFHMILSLFTFSLHVFCSVGEPFSSL